MKLKLPDGNVKYLDTTIPLEERKKVVENILDEWKDYFESSWKLKKTEVCLEILGNYLCMVKDGEDKNKEDKYILSEKKVKRMTKGSKHNSNFTDLSIEQKLVFGISELEESGD